MVGAGVSIIEADSKDSFNKSDPDSNGQQLEASIQNISINSRSVADICHQEVACLYIYKPLLSALNGVHFVKHYSWNNFSFIDGDMFVFVFGGGGQLSFQKLLCWTNEKVSIQLLNLETISLMSHHTAS